MTKALPAKQAVKKNSSTNKSKPARRSAGIRDSGKKSNAARTRVTSKEGAAVRSSPDLKRQQEIQEALYEIADVASAVKDMQSFYKRLHKIVGKLMYAKNFFIALYDKQEDLITWQYYVDTVDLQAPSPILLRDHRGATGWVLRHGKSLAEADGSVQTAFKRGELEQIGTDSDGIAAPLKTNNETIGVILVQCYVHAKMYAPEDVRVLEFVAQHIATALTRARALEAERRRTQELAILNSVQAALASKLDFQGVVDAVGDKLCEIFPGQSVGINLADRAANLIHGLYTFENGRRYPNSNWPMGKGLASLVINSRKPLVMNSDVSQNSAKLGAIYPGDQGDPSSWLGVPITVGETAIGDVVLEDWEHENAYPESTVSLVQSLAATLGLALDNARLFDEAQKSNAQISEALERESASNDILRVIAESPTDIQPVLDAVAESAARLCNSYDVLIERVDGDVYRLVAHWGPVPTILQEIVAGTPLNADTVTGRAILEHRLIHVHDVRDGSEYPLSQEWSKISGQRTLLAAPLMREGAAIGAIVLRRQEVSPFNDGQIALLKTFADQAAIAIENVRLFNETTRLLKESEQRAAELAIINSVQQGLVSKLGVREIYELVGTELRKVFPKFDILLGTYDPLSDIATVLYGMEQNLRVQTWAWKVDGTGFVGELQRTKKTILVNENLAAESKRIGGTSEGEAERRKSALFIPLLVGNVLRGAVSLEDMEHEHAFSDSDVRLLETIANSMSVALENARLFTAEQQRVSELQVINSIQQGLAEKLDFQAIVDLVGDKLREVLNISSLGIAWYDEPDNLVRELYLFDEGQRKSSPPPHAAAPGGIAETMRKTRLPLVLNTVVEHEKYRDFLIPTPGRTGQVKSSVYAPIISGDRVLGDIGVESYEIEYAYGESELRLLTTVAASFGTALENARLFDETQRLLKETEQRAAELAIINSVQEGLAAKLDMQAIYDLVGDRIREIFSADVVGISLYDQIRNVMRRPYIVDHGERYFPEPGPPSYYWSQLILVGLPVLLNTYEELEQQLAKFGTTMEKENIAGPTHDNSFIYVPLRVGAEVTGSIIVAKLAEYAFHESDVRLLQTLAASMSVALENARLFDETQRLLKETEQRNAELAIINSAQTALATKLDFQGIIDAVGSKMLELFPGHSLGINQVDRVKNVIRAYYIFENGKRYPNAEWAMDQGLTSHVIATGKPLVINSDMVRRAEELGAIFPGDQSSPKSWMCVPMVVGTTTIGSIVLQNYQHEFAYSDSTVDLVQTLATGMGVALENARLFDETQRLLKETEQRAAELAIINSVQEGLASKLEMHGIYELVGEKIRAIFNVHGVVIYWYDYEQQLAHTEYAYEKGQRLIVPAQAATALQTRILQAGKTFVANEHVPELFQKYGHSIRAGSMPKSVVAALFHSEGRVKGAVTILDLDKEFAFGDSEVRLLETVTNGMSVALENARLFKSEQQRAAELAIINSVQEGLASKLDMQAIIDLVGEKIKQIFNTHVVSIALYDRQENLIHYPYVCERGERLSIESRPPHGIRQRIIESHQAIIVNRDVPEANIKYGNPVLSGEEPKSAVFVPMMVGNLVTGIISLQNLEQENAFPESDVNLLMTLANSMSVALENARLFEAERRRTAELAIINGVQHGLASQLDMKAIYDLVGEKLREIFSVQSISIYSGNLKTRMETREYSFEKGKKLERIEVPLNSLLEYLLGLNATFVRNKDFPQFAAQFKDYVVGQGEIPASIVDTPVLRNEEAGIYVGVAIMDIDGEKIFTDADVRLLETVADALSIALENARLFDETQRLLKETEQRATELSTVNTVSTALAGELDVSALIQLVGEQIRTTFHADIAYVALLDSRGDTISFPYVHGEQLAAQEYGEGLTGRIIEEGQPLLINQGLESGQPGLASAAIGRDVRSYLGVPIFVGVKAVGVVSVQKIEQENAFDENDQRLLSTIAANVGVALSNARLFDEIQTRNREINENLEQQTATSEILQAIASSPTDIQPVLDVIAESALRLCGGISGAVYRSDGKLLYMTSSRAVNQETADEVQRSYPRPLDSNAGFSARAILDKKTYHIPDIENYPDVPAVTVRLAHAGGFRGGVWVPLMREGRAIGAIGVVKRESGPFSDKQIALLETFASQAVIAIENVRLFNELQERNREITENLEQQTATSEILKVIASSPTDIQPVLDVIAESARKLCNGVTSAVYRTDGRLIYEAASSHYTRAALEESVRSYPAPLARDRMSGRAILDRTIVQSSYMQTDPDIPEVTRRYMDALGMNSLIVVPMLREGEAIGSVGVGKSDPSPFSEKQIALLQTFASQAVIAIENVRLFNELQERNREITENLEQQTATSEILNVIASSPTEIQPVLDVIVENARKLLNSNLASLYRTDGQMVYEVAQTDISSDALEAAREVSIQSYPVALDRANTLSSRVILDRTILHIPDMQHEPDLPEITQRYVHAHILRSVLFVPLMREGEAIGCVGVGKREAGPFTDKQIALMQTFASQAVIAIENVRLFNELQASNREISENLEQQTATSEILKVIASSPTDIQPVLEVIAENARRLCNGNVAEVYRSDGEMVYEVAQSNPTPAALEVRSESYPAPLKRETSLSARSIVDKAIVHTPNMKDDASLSEITQRYIKAQNIQCALFVPMLREGEAIGAIGVSKPDAAPFSEKQIALLQTFASQAVIAIENVRLFNELQQSNREITENLEQQTATSGILRVIASSPTDIQPVLDVVAEYGARLSDSVECAIFLTDNNAAMRLAAHAGPEQTVPLGTEFPLNRESIAGASILDRKIYHVPNINEVGDQYPLSKSIQKNFLAFLGMPLLREGKSMGVIFIRRTEARAFTEKQIQLVGTFASQAVIALENVRLFNELQQRNREISENLEQQTATSEILRVIASSPTDIQPVLDAVAESAARLCDSYDSAIALVDGSVYRVAAQWGEVPLPRENIVDGVPLNRDTLTGRSILDMKMIHVADILAEPEGEYPLSKKFSDISKQRTMLAAPLMREGTAIGAIFIRRQEVRPFTDKQGALLELFASQAVIAIENVRLFNELQQRNREITENLEQQTASSEILRVIASSPTDIKPVMQTIAESAARLCELEDASIYLIDEGRLRKAASFGTIPSSPVGTEVQIARDNIVGRAAIERKSIHVHDLSRAVETDYPASRLAQEKYGFRTILNTPLTSKGAVVGVIVSCRTEVRPFSEKQINLLETFAAQAAIAIENVRLFNSTQSLLKETEQRAAELAIINSVQQGLASKLDLQAIYDLVGDTIRDIFAAQGTAIYLFDQREETQQTPYCFLRHRFTIESHPLSGPAKLMIDSTQPRIYRSNAEYRALGGGVLENSEEFMSGMYVPLMVGKEIKGMIGISSLEKDNAYGESDLRLLTTLANSMSVALENVRLFEEVTQRKEYFEGLVQNSPVAVVTIDNNANVVSWNPAAEKLFGYSQAEAIGQNLDTLVASAEALHAEAVGFTERGLNTARAITRRTRKDGSLVDVELFGVPITVAGQRVGGIAIYHDITELERARKEAIAANQAKSSFLANMSHELRTPLNAIIGFTRIVRRKAEGALPEKQTDNLDKVLTSADHLLSLINTVLDIAKIEAGRMDVQASNFNIHALADQCLHTAQPLVKPSVILEKQIDSDLTLIHSDQDKLKQILLNLLSNAAKFTNQGSIRLQMRRADSTLIVEVIDSGIGIETNALDRIFEEFQQADVSTTREYGGTGLGLTISRNLARLLGGDLTATSEPGAGSTFRLTIPLQYAGASSSLRDREPAASQRAGAASAGNAPKKRVLVIDDDPDATYLLQESLNADEFEVIGSNNALDAHLEAGALQPDAILLDILMPDKDGWQVLHDLKADPRTSDIPVVLLTIVDKKALGFRLGAAAYLLKPLDPAAVFEALQRVTKAGSGIRHVLVVDDDPQIADMIRQLLPESDYSVDSAEDGAAGLRSVQSRRPDVILLDLMMPVLDGFGVIERLRADAQLRDIPILVISAKDLTNEESDLLRQSVAAVMRKQGLDGERLLQEIESALEQRR